ncbi:MAG TPA: hypothetical protein VHD31_03595 [Candidatus Paceibacterota bacterium]|nr:hypothetical protein [Candidatus Paceibacterota bacterium]
MEDPSHFQPTYEHKYWHVVLWGGLFLAAVLAGGYVYVIAQNSVDSAAQLTDEQTTIPTSKFVNEIQLLAATQLTFSSSTEVWWLSYGDLLIFPRLENGEGCFLYQREDLCKLITISGTEYTAYIKPESSSEIESAYKKFLNEQGYVFIYEIAKSQLSSVYEKILGSKVQLVVVGSELVHAISSTNKKDVNVPPDDMRFAVFVSDVFDVNDTTTP